MDSFLISVDGDSIISFAQALKREVVFNSAPSHPIHLIYWEIMLVLPSKYVQNPSLLQPAYSSNLPLSLA